MHTVSNTSGLVNKKTQTEARIYRSDIVKNHRKISKSLSRKRRAEGSFSSRRKNLTAIKDWIDLISLVLFQTYLGTEVKKTSAKWLAQDLNRLRSSDEKQLSEKTAGNKLRTLKKTCINDKPVINISSPRTVNKNSKHYTLGTHVKVESMEGLLTLYAVLWSLYYSGLDPIMTKGEHEQKVKERVIKDLVKSGVAISQEYVDIIGKWSLDNLHEWTKMGSHVDIIGKSCGHNWEFYSITPQLHSITNNIPASQGSSGISFEIGKQVEQEHQRKPDPYRNPRIKYDNFVDNTARTISNPFVNLRVCEKPIYKWEEDEPIKPIGHDDVDQEILKAVRATMIRYDEDFEPLKSDYRLYRQASIEIAHTAEKMVQNGAQRTRSEIYGISKYAVEDYINKSKLYGYNEVPKYYDRYANNF